MTVGHHITRTSLPWRPADRTICGQPLDQYADGVVLDLPAAVAMSKRLGQQRFALVICMTCANNVRSWSDWDTDPLARMAREVTGGGYGRIEPVIVHELRAIAALIAAHRDEFDAIVRAYESGDVAPIRRRS